VSVSLAARVVVVGCVTRRCPEDLDIDNAKSEVDVHRGNAGIRRILRKSVSTREWNSMNLSFDTISRWEESEAYHILHTSSVTHDSLTRTGTNILLFSIGLLFSKIARHLPP
jgi:hypothetical protein